ncbi:MAG: right-handed parallel beta-helix repeat-containing protein [Planctomycetota bacterium]|jgi:alpha-N-arabinofuranosidase
MSEQVGLIGTHWSKGWVIENNVISHSMNTGITLGRYDLGKFGIAMPAVSAPGYVESIELALEHGWSKENIGSHVVRNNHISHCEKNGIHGSLGGIIEGNTICDIAMRGWIGGPDVAGLKLLASHDTIISHNHIYRCGAVGGIWLDWMAQGTRVTGNLLHDNSQDIFVEVNHGPFLVDNNLFLSPRGLLESCGGGAYVHNLFGCQIRLRAEKTRETPFHKPHSTEVLGLSKVVGDVGNVYLAGAKPSTRDRDALVTEASDPGIKLQEKPDGWWLEIAVDPAWTSERKRVIVTTESLGMAKVPDAPYEQSDGTPYRIDTDYFGRKRKTENPEPGPFRFPSKKLIRLKVWPKKQD